MIHQSIYRSVLTGGLLGLLLSGCRASVASDSVAELKASSTIKLQAVPGENYLAEIRDLIANAQNEITILHFNFFTENGETRAIAELIKSQKIKKPELKINIILEGEKDLNKPDGAGTRNHLTKDFFESSGVNVHFISGVRQEGTKPGVTHAKAIVIDNTVLTGSTNLTNTSLTKNNEFNLKIRDGKTAQFIRNYVNDLLTDSTVLKPESIAFEGGKVLTDNNFQAEAINIINMAKRGETLYIANYLFQTSDPLTDGNAIRILDAILTAKKKGVTIKVYLEQNLDPNLDPKNQKITKENKETAAKLVSHKINVYLDPGNKISHAKMIILDGAQKILLQGSSNLFRGDLDENHQVNVLVENKDVVANALLWLTAKFAYEGTTYAEQTPQKMFRLWFGYAQNRTNLSSLVDGVNEKLVPGTLNYAKGRGLSAYLPALLKSDSAQPEVPDEVAIISYNSEDMYNAARLTPPLGPKYGPLHFEPGLFTKTTDQGFTSASAVAVEFNKETFKVGSGIAAYHINAQQVSWQDGDVSLFILKPNQGTSISSMVDATFATIQSSVTKNGIDAALVAIDATHELVLVWAHQTNGMAAINFPGSDIQVLKKIRYSSRFPISMRFGLDEGINIKFDNGIMPSRDLMQPILDELKTRK